MGGSCYVSNKKYFLKTINSDTVSRVTRGVKSQSSNGEVSVKFCVILKRTIIFKNYKLKKWYLVLEGLTLDSLLLLVWHKWGYKLEDYRSRVQCPSFPKHNSETLEAAGNVKFLWHSLGNYHLNNTISFLWCLRNEPGMVISDFSLWESR